MELDGQLHGMQRFMVWASASPFGQQRLKIRKTKRIVQNISSIEQEFIEEVER